MTTTRIVHYRRLEAELATARQAVADKEREFDSFRLSICDVKVGDIVTLTNGGLMARVAEVQPLWVRPRPDGTFDKPWLLVNLRKKDGSWSIARYRTYGDWTLGTPEVTA